MRQSADLQRFEGVVMPHLAAAYNLARRLTRNAHDAEDVVQEAYLRAVRAFDGYRGGDPRAWLLTIVRNTCFSWLRQNRTAEAAGTADDIDDGLGALAGDSAAEPEVSYIRNADRELLQDAIGALAVEFREALVLRELEGFSYKEISDIADVPIGTVMSRLSRARQQLRQFIRRRTLKGT